MGEGEKKMSKCCAAINRKLLPIKVHYFFFFAAVACAIPFRTVFAKQMGLTATEVGVIFCAAPLLRIITNPLFGFLLDYFKKIRITISVIMISCAVTLVAMVFIPPKLSAHSNKDFEAAMEHNFHFKMMYECQNTSYPYVCEKKFLLHNEYRRTDNSSKSEQSFSCDAFCTSENETFGVDKSDILQCSQKIKFDFKAAVRVSSCDIEILIDNGKGTATDDLLGKSMSFNFGAESIRHLGSRISPFQNCSGALSLDPNDRIHADEFSQENTHISSRNPSVKSDVDKGAKIYYTVHEFLVNVYPLNSACQRKFECKAKGCLPQMSQIKFKQLFSENEEFLSSQFWSMFVLNTISAISLSAVIFMMDSVCYELLQDRKDSYGNQRMFGTIGWGLGSLLGGFINQVVSTDSGDIDYTMSFCVLGLLLFVDLIPVNRIKITDLKYSPNILKDVSFLFTKLGIVYNLMMVFVIGLFSGFFWNYQFWFMQELGSSQILLGLSQAVECMLELPTFIVAGWIVQKIGHDHCNSVTLICLGLRYLWCVFIYDPWWILAPALFSGPSYALFHTSRTMYAKNESPPGTEATVQSLTHLSFEGLGAAMGVMIGGIAVDKFGSRSSFLYTAELCLLMLVINVLMTIYFLRAKKIAPQREQSSSRL